MANNWASWDAGHKDLKNKAKATFVKFQQRDGMHPDKAGVLFESMHKAGSADAFKVMPVHKDTGKEIPQGTPRQGGEAMSRSEKVGHINTFENAYNHAGFGVSQKAES